ncbi:hypothetical protein Emag_005669 [Eimeria magna]
MKQSSELAAEAKEASRCKRNLRRRRIPKRIPAEDALDVQSRTQMRPKEIELLYARQGFRRVAPYGLMGFPEFCSMLGVLAMLEETQIADRLFSAFDRDHNKQLTFREFAVALGTMMCGREEDKLDLGFRILNPSYTGTGASLSDYDFEFPDEGSISDGCPAAAKGTDAATELLRSGGSAEASADGGEAPLQQPQPQHQQQQQQPEEMQQQQQQQDEVYEPHQHHKTRVSLAAFNRLKETVYADSVPASAFVSLVRAMEASRKILLGDDGSPLATQEIERIFLPLSTLLPDGTRRMFERDYKYAVRNSASFIALLGVDVGGAAADTSTGSQAAKAWDETTEAERMTTEGIVKSMQDVTSRLSKAVSRRSSGNPGERRPKSCQNQQLLLQLQQCMHNLQEIEKQLDALKALPACPIAASRAAAEAAAAAAAAATAVELSREDRQETWSSPLALESDASSEAANREAAAAAAEVAAAAAAADTAKAAAKGRAAAGGTAAAIPSLATAEAAALASSAAAAAAAEAAAAEAASAAAALEAATTTALSTLRDTELQLLQMLEATKGEADQEPPSPISAPRTGDSAKGGDAKRDVTAQKLAAVCVPTHIAAAASAAAVIAAAVSAAAASAAAASASAVSAAAFSAAAASAAVRGFVALSTCNPSKKHTHCSAAAAAAAVAVGAAPQKQPCPLSSRSSGGSIGTALCDTITNTTAAAATAAAAAAAAAALCCCLPSVPAGFRDRRSMANPENEPDDPRA